MDTLVSFFVRNGFLPYCRCFTWTPGVLWTMVASDLMIAAAWLSIPMAICRFGGPRAVEPGCRNGRGTGSSNALFLRLLWQARSDQERVEVTKRLLLRLPESKKWAQAIAGNCGMDGGGSGC